MAESIIDTDDVRMAANGKACRFLFKISQIFVAILCVILVEYDLIFEGFDDAGTILVVFGKVGNTKTAFAKFAINGVAIAVELLSRLPNHKT